MKNAFIEIPADEQYFPIGELPRMFADAVPCWYQADTDLGQQAVNIVRARKDFWPQIEADAKNGTLPVLNPSSRLPAPCPSAPASEYGKHFLVTREVLKKYAAATFGIDVREKVEPPQPGQETPEAIAPSTIEQPPAWDSLKPDEKKAAWNDLSPVARREKAAELVMKHGGNKTRAGAEVGISRERIGQITKEGKPEVPEAPLPVNKWTQAAGLVKPKRSKASR